jgi:hypothetical protein
MDIYISAYPWRALLPCPIKMLQSYQYTYLTVDLALLLSSSAQINKLAGIGINSTKEFSLTWRSVKK